MKKRIVAIIIVLCIIAAFAPTVSHAALPPYFIAVNDILLPFNENTMPYVSGSTILAPHTIFGSAEVWSVASSELDRVRIYTGISKHVDFYTARGVAEDQDGNILSWPAARRIGGRFYVPLRQVCDYFGLSCEIIEVSRDIIPEEQMYVIRIKSGEGIDGASFVAMNGNVLRAAYDAYYMTSPASPPSTSGAQTSPDPSNPTASPPDSPLPTITSPIDTPTPSPVETPPPTYDDVTIYHSFFNLSAGGADVVLALLDANATSGYRFCFFVNAGDIIADAGLIRRLSADGHAIGIWLEEGTYDEYAYASALLYEAAKIKTVIISGSREARNARGMADEHGLIYWATSRGLVYDDTFSVDMVTEKIPKVGGMRQNLISSCSENTALMLSGILAFLRQYEYKVAGISETTAPV